MSKGHSFGFPGLHPSLCPFLDLQACSKSALDTVKLPQHSSAQHPWPQARLHTSQTCWDSTLPVQRQGTAWAVLTSQSLILVAHNQQGFFCSRPFFCFLSLSLLLLWLNYQFLAGKNKVQPPAEVQLSSMQCVPPGHPCLEKNSLQTVHCDHAPSHGSWL